MARFTRFAVAIPCLCLTLTGALPAQEIEVEVKHLISEAAAEAAFAKLNPLFPEGAINQRVCYFDTAPAGENAKGALDKAGIILRAREKADDDDDSTLKLRGAEGATVTGAIANSLEIEQDWTSPSKINFSRSQDDKKVKEGRFEEVMSGSKKPKSLFEKQVPLMEEQNKGFDWGSLKRYGPLKAQLWKKVPLEGFDRKVTVEKWFLEKEGAPARTLLEISAKVKGASKEEISIKAEAFYKAALKFETGESPAASKTSLVLDYFKPGH